MFTRACLCPLSLVPGKEAACLGLKGLLGSTAFLANQPFALQGSEGQGRRASVARGVQIPPSFENQGLTSEAPAFSQHNPSPARFRPRQKSARSQRRSPRERHLKRKKGGKKAGGGRRGGMSGLPQELPVLAPREVVAERKHTTEKEPGAPPFSLFPSPPTPSSPSPAGASGERLKAGAPATAAAFGGDSRHARRPPFPSPPLPSLPTCRGE